eukprot:TRINITY_DN1852_c0_g1_i11.p1 TRINITY_DN1852_c0_g1~~TRINITY_DN1852_c0_g1_i11.p1  ORF type:complete len:608 (+),score=83.51 TRINITY_DN1852_c0_g1_i11:1129-2952(+)
MITLRLLILTFFFSFFNCEVIKLGLIYDDQLIPALKQVLTSVEIAIEDINNSNFLKNFEIQLLPFPASNEEDANEAVKNLSMVGAFGAIGPAFSFQSTIIAISASFLEFPLISNSATADALSKNSIYPYFLRTIPKDSAQTQVIVDLLKYFNLNDIVIFSTTEAYSVGLAQSVTDFASKNGLRVRTVVYFTPGDKNLDDKIKIIQGSAARIILNFMFVEDFQNSKITATNLDFTGSPYQNIASDSLSSATIYFNGSQEIQDLKFASFGMTSTAPRTGDPNSKNLKIFIKKLKERGVDVLEGYSTYAYDAAWVYAIALHELLEVQNLQISEVRGKMLLEQLKLTKYNGLTGLVNFDNNGDRDFKIYSLRNLHQGRLYGYENELISEFGIWTSSSGLNISIQPLWSDGTTNFPDSTPKGPVEYYSCSRKITTTDLRGVIIYDEIDDNPEFLPSNYYCDGIIDCNNWSDEDFSCFPSLEIAFIVTGIIAGLSLFIFSIAIIFLVKNKKRGRVRVTGLLFLGLICVACFTGCCSIFSLFGKANNFNCTIRYWIILLSSSILIGFNIILLNFLIVLVRCVQSNFVFGVYLEIRHYKLFMLPKNNWQFMFFAY